MPVYRSASIDTGIGMPVCSGRAAAGGPGEPDSESEPEELASEYPSHHWHDDDVICHWASASGSS